MRADATNPNNGGLRAEAEANRDESMMTDSPERNPDSAPSVFLERYPPLIPQRRRFLTILAGIGQTIFIISPAALLPVFYLLESRRVFSDQLRGLTRLGVSMEAFWILIATAGAAVIQALSSLPAGGKILRGEGVWGGALLAAPLFGLLRGFGFDTTVSLAAAGALWLGLTATVVISEMKKAGERKQPEEAPGQSEGKEAPATRETEETPATRETEETPATRETEETPATRETEETPAPATSEEMPTEKTAGGDNEEKPSENTPGTEYPRRDSNARHQV